MASSEYLEKIRQNLTASGFPLQLRVGSMLDLAGFSPLYSQHYVDLDGDKGREIDVIGQRRWLVINGKTYYSLNLSANLVVECRGTAAGLLS